MMPRSSCAQPNTASPHSFRFTFLLKNAPAANKIDVTQNSTGGANTKTAAMILAAGKPANGKIPRPLIYIGDKTMLLHEIDTLQSVPVNELVVVIGYRDNIVKRHIEHRNCGVAIALNRHYSETEMLDSVLLGAKKLNERAERVLMLPADTPLVSERTCSLLLNADSEIAAIPRYNGVTGHPIMLTEKALSMLADYDGTDRRHHGRQAHAGYHPHVPSDPDRRH